MKIKPIKGMIVEKTQKSFRRPTFMDVLAEMIFVVSKRSACLFYEVGAVIFKNDQILSFGYNGPSKGDVHCYEVGCARMKKGKIETGSGLCRGSHAELNAIGNAAKNGINIDGASMLVTFRPCYSCAKQIVNQGIKKVYYLFDYDREDNVRNYLRRLGVKLEKYSSWHFDDWMKKFK
jgi:dCMP deaminase